MASGQSKGVSRKVLGGDGAERDVRRGGKQHPSIQRWWGKYGESPEFLTKGQFRRGAEGVQSMLRPRVVGERGEDGGLEGGGASFKT